jgi:hypothetical protein
MLPPRFHILGEAEGAGARDVLFVLARAHVERHALAGGIDHRVVELDLEAEHITVVRVEPGPLQAGALAFAHLHRLEHANEALGRVLQLDAGALQQEDEARRRAIEHRHFIGADVDGQVVQAQARAGREQVLDGLHLGRARVAADAEGRGHARVAHGLRVDGDAHRLRQVGAAKNDATVGRCGLEDQLDLLPTVHAHADGAGERFEGALLEHHCHSSDAICGARTSKLHGTTTSD